VRREKMKGRLKLRGKIGINIVLFVFGALTMIPFMYVFTSSLLSASNSQGNAVYLFPFEFHFENYIKGWNHIRMGSAFRNTLFVSIISGIIHILICTMAAFPLARKKFPGSSFINYSFLGSLLIPSQVTLIPILIMLRTMGLIGNLWGVIFPAVCDAFAIFVFVGFFRGIPRELEESAKMDGCSEIFVFARIYIPLSLAPIATIALFHFLGVWNDVVLPAMVLSGTMDKLTLSPLMSLFLNKGVGPQTIMLAPTPNVKAAVLIINLLPLLALYAFLQRFFKEGIALGALKG
jgi:ABC-type glycerol-3-phosphate transport system permease component